MSEVSTHDVMAENNTLPRSFRPSTADKDKKQTIGQRITSCRYPEEFKPNVTIVSCEKAPSLSNAQLLQQNVNHHKLAVVPEKCAKTNRTTQVSCISFKKTLVIVKIISMVVLALVIAGLLSIPLIKITEGAKDTISVNVSGGSMCQNILRKRQFCFPDGENIHKIELSLIEKAESKANEYEAQFNLLLRLVPVNQQCEEELRALVCAAGFIELCDTSKIRTLLHDCERTITKTCEIEFPQIQAILESLDMSLTCDSLVEQETSVVDTITMSSRSGVLSYENGNTRSKLNMSRNCSDGFFVGDLGLCKPECGEWWPRTSSEFKLLATTHVTFASVGGISILIVLILSCLNYKMIFQFPSIFIVYQMLSLFPFIGNVLVSYMDIKGLLCSKRDVTEVLEKGNASGYCTISGAVWIYFTAQVPLWWLFHIIMTFISVFWPFKYQYWRKLGYFKYIHVAVVITALIVPLIPVIIVSLLGYFNIVAFYPPICFGYDIKPAFYSYLFPMMCTTAVGIYLLILIFAKFFTEECTPKKKGKRQAEIKIFLLLLSYVISWPAFFGSSAYIMIESFDWPAAIEEYLICEASGTNETCSRDGLDQFSVVPGLVFILASLYPISFLLYFLKCSRLNKVTKTMFSCK